MRIIRLLFTANYAANIHLFLRMAKKNTKCRTWTFVLYPEDEGTADLLAYLKTDNIEKIRGYYIMHQPKAKMDDETGE